MKKSALLIEIIVILSLSGCNNKTLSVKLDFPISMRQEIKTLMTKGKTVVYYHSGDCSFCYGTLMAISKEYPDLLLISVSASKNTILIDYYLEKIGFKGISLIDSASLFLKNNQKVLSTQNIFLIDSQYKILAAGENLDENLKRKINRVLTP